MNYEKEIRKYKKAIDELYKQQRKAKLDNYYVIFANLEAPFISRHGKKYYVNDTSTIDTTSFDYLTGVKRCLFTKQEAINFAIKSEEPEILKASIKAANQEIPSDVEIDLLNI